MAAALGIEILAWGPLGGAVLTGKFRPGQDAEGSQQKEYNETFGRFSDQNSRIVDTVQKLAKQYGYTTAQIALAWLLQRPQPVIPILGARLVEQLQDNLSALAVRLDPAALAELETVSAVPMGFPNEMLIKGAPFRYGGTLDSIFP